jgi:hypothetical protein
VRASKKEISAFRKKENTFARYVPNDVLVFEFGKRRNQWVILDRPSRADAIDLPDRVEPRRTGRMIEG